MIRSRRIPTHRFAFGIPRFVLALSLQSLVLASCTSTTAGTSSSSDAPTVAASEQGARAALSAGGTVSLNRGVGFGLLRVMTLGERPGPLDVVIYAGLPNELPRVAGVITTVMQTPLSHVNLRAVQDKVPNAVIRQVLDDPNVGRLIGRYVRFEVANDTYTLEPATQAEVEAHHASRRPKIDQTPKRDLSVASITPLRQVGFDDWDAFGVKSANLATLARLDLPKIVVPDGYAVPFSFYDEFMRSNGLYRVANRMLADETFRSDPEVQDRTLASFRSLIKSLPLPRELSQALEKTRKSFPADQPIRCRSSTNNEDLPGFSGAGLYDSKTQHLDEGPLDKCVKQVFASVWNLRAFLEREYYRVDHLATAMGVLLIPNTSNELANGVGVSVDPIYGEPDAYYLNAQVGENLVTNPGASETPEELLLYVEGTMDVVTRSSLVAPGATVLSKAITDQLRVALAEIHRRFGELYKVRAGEKFAMEIEFKVLSSGALMIKQARPWQFS